MPSGSARAPCRSMRPVPRKSVSRAALAAAVAAWGAVVAAAAVAVTAAVAAAVVVAAATAAVVAAAVATNPPFALANQNFQGGAKAAPPFSFAISIAAGPASIPGHDSPGCGG